MVPDDYWYSGSPQGRASVSLHEIGHIFDATHEDITRPPNEPQYTHATWYLDGLSVHQTVMWHSYFEQANTMEFSSNSSPYCGSSVVCHGDSTHDNARRISETRDTVAMYAHKDKIGVFRPSNGNWLLSYDYTGVTHKTIPFGTTGDIPVIGDYNGDGLTDVAVFRPSTGFWYMDYDLNSGVDKSFRFGLTGDIPVVGDWDGNGTSDAGVFRPSNGNWYMDYNLNGGVDLYFHFGSAGDIPVIGDWNGGGYSHAGVFRPSNGNWYLSSGEVGTITFHFGSNGDIPNIGVWKRENI
jgi:hypothetical protein